MLRSSDRSPATASSPTAGRCSRSTVAPSTPWPRCPRCSSPTTGSARSSHVRSRTRTRSRSCWRRSRTSTSPAIRSDDRPRRRRRARPTSTRTRRDEQQTALHGPDPPADVEFAAGCRRVRLRADHRLRGGPGHAGATSRPNSEGTILLDAHGPAARSPAAASGKHRLWVERDAWLPYIDILKMNLEEAGCSWFPRGAHPTPTTAGHPDRGRAARRSPSTASTAACRRSASPSTNSGCVVYHLDAAGAMLEEHGRPRIPVDERRRHHRLRRLVRGGHGVRLPVRTATIVQAASTATRWARSAARGSELAVYLPLAETDKQIAGAPTVPMSRAARARGAVSSAEWLVTESGFDPERGQLRRDAVHRRQRHARHPRHPRGGPPRRAVGHLPGRRVRRPRVPVIDLVNAPDWLSLAVFVDGVAARRRHRATVVEHERALDLRARRAVPAAPCSSDADGRRTRLETLRCASMADRRICALRVEVTPVEPRRADHRRERVRRRPAQPRAAAGLPRGHHLRARDALGEVGARQAPGSRPHGRAGGRRLSARCARIDTGVTLGYGASTTFPAAAGIARSFSAATSTSRSGHVTVGSGEPGAARQAGRVSARLATTTSTTLQGRAGGR